MNQNQIVAKLVRYSEWAGMVRERHESVLSVAEYCKQNNICETAYFYKLRRVRHAAIQASGLEFIDLKDADEGSGSSLPVLPASNISINAKYTNAVLFYRIEKQFESDGLDISRQEISKWTIACAERYLSVLYDHLNKRMYDYHILYADVGTERQPCIQGIGHDTGHI